MSDRDLIDRLRRHADMQDSINRERDSYCKGPVTITIDLREAANAIARLIGDARRPSPPSQQEGAYRYVPWHIEEGEPTVRHPKGHIFATFASDDDAKLVADLLNAHFATPTPPAPETEEREGGGAIALCYAVGPDGGVDWSKQGRVWAWLPDGTYRGGKRLEKE